VAETPRAAGTRAAPPRSAKQKKRTEERARPARSRAGAGGSRPGLVAGAVAGVAVVAVVAALLAVKLAGSGSSSTTAQVAPADVVAAVTHVPSSALNAVGPGNPSVVRPPVAVQPRGGSLPPLLEDHGLPRVVYIGAEYCPFCAAERWPLVVALSRFGTFRGLRVATSSSTDVYPSTQTLSFYGSSYSSPYLVFTPVETETSTGAPLERPTPTEQRLIDTYDQPPYVAANQAGAIPFVDFANRYVIVGASYSPQVLQGLDRAAIAGSLSVPSTQQAQAIDAAANDITAALCRLTGGRPTTVCDQSGVVRAEAVLGAPSGSAAAASTPGTHP
jgi:hypothetical protein